MAWSAVALFAYQIFTSYVHPYTRIMWEASNELLLMYNRGQMPIPMRRLASFQNKWLPTLAAKFDADLWQVLYLYLTNDLLHYVILFAIVWRVSKSFFLATGMLFVNLFLWGGNYFILTNEMYLTLPWLFLANFISYKGYRQYRWLVLVAAILAIWSHPINLITLAVSVVVFRYDRLLGRLGVIITSGILFIRLATMTAYDGGHTMLILQGFETMQWGVFARHVNTGLAVLVLLALWLLTGINKWQKLFATVTYMGLLLLIAVRQLNWADTNNIEMLVPVHLAVVCLLWFALYQNTSTRGLQNIAIVIVVGWMFWFSYEQFKSQYHYALHRSAELNCVLEDLSLGGYSGKLLAHRSSITGMSFDPVDYHTESITFSALNPNIEQAIQLVVEDEETYTEVLALPDSVFFAGPDYLYELNYLKGPYQLSKLPYQPVEFEPCVINEAD